MVLDSKLYFQKHGNPIILRNFLTNFANFEHFQYKHQQENKPN